MSEEWVISPTDHCVWDRATLREFATDVYNDTIERHSDSDSVEFYAGELADELEEIDALPEWVEGFDLTSTSGEIDRDVFGGTWIGAHYSTAAGSWYVTDDEGFPASSYEPGMPKRPVFWVLA